jgi:ABC-type transport system involved in multi-copper enzyme maturation permease subunit
VTHLLAADRVRFGRRRDLWILVALVPVVVALMFLSEFNNLTTLPQENFFIDPPDPVLEAQMREQFLSDFRQQLVAQVPAYAFPASLVKVAGNVAPVILLAIYLAAALIAGEFEWGTVRTVHLTSSRGRTMAVRVGVVVALIAVATAIGLVLAAIMPFLLSVQGRPLQEYAAPVPNFLSDLAVRLIAVLPFVAVPAFLAVVARSTGLAFLLTLLFFLLDLAVTGAPLWPSSPVPWVPALTVSGSLTRLLGANDSSLALIAPSWVSVVALLGWAVVPALLAVFLFRRLDLNE